MTLGEFLYMLAKSPEVMLFYFIALPLTAFLLGIFGRGEGHLSPWKYVYSGVVYMAAVPGIFTVILNLYLFLFERQSIYDAQLYTQVFPIICAILSLYLVRRNVDFGDIPGFGKISGLMWMLLVVIALMWVMEKTHLIAITILPFQWILLFFVCMLIVFRLGWRRVFD